MTGLWAAIMFFPVAALRVAAARLVIDNLSRFLRSKGRKQSRHTLRASRQQGKSEHMLDGCSRPMVEVTTATMASREEANGNIGYAKLQKLVRGLHHNM